MPANTLSGRVRKATESDASRILEIHQGKFVFDVSKLIDKFFVYDDGMVKGYACLKDGQLKMIGVDINCQNQGIGSALLQSLNVDYLWISEKNQKAIAFFKKNGFELSNIKLPETKEHYLVLMKKSG